MSNDAEDETADEAAETTDDAVDSEETVDSEEKAESDAESETEESSESTESGFQDGDFIELDYTARTVEGGDLVDTTSQEVADEEGVGEQQEFGPRTLVLGQGHLFPGVEDDIVGKAVGDTGTVVIPAAEAFGVYDESEVRTVTKDKIPEDDRYPGAHVEIEGQHGRVETIVGGRARVDFNHPLAGRDVEYEYEIVGEVTDREDRANGILSMMLDVDLDVWFETDTVEEERVVESDEDETDDATDADEATDEDAVEAEDDADESDADEESDEEEPETEIVEVEKETLYIEADPRLSMNQQWMMGKQQIAQQLIDLLDIDRVIVQETLDGMGGMGMPGMGGGGGIEEMLDEELDDEDVDAEELAEEIDLAGE